MDAAAAQLGGTLDRLGAATLAAARVAVVDWSPCHAEPNTVAVEQAP